MIISAATTPVEDAQEFIKLVKMSVYCENGWHAWRGQCFVEDSLCNARILLTADTEHEIVTH
eukprot:16724-Eustigmatos_ZCMA.PRE.1